MILASKSPRRKEILEDTGFKIKIKSTQMEEISDKISLTDKIMDIARKKTMIIAEQYPDEFVVGADTVVELDGKIIGKPINKSDAFNTLKMLSGRKHNVITAYSLINLSKKIDITDYDITKVSFRELSDNMIKWYISTNEPMDKAGSYGIQGKGAIFVNGINGDFFNVMGFPIGKFVEKISLLGIELKDIENI
ncbi:Maf family protein [Fusobacterium sp.]|uniref:nucleoside triphosphate pyrophosphatase n=1 Tax=Fusobacterium sp. TaxID=68766 RepID=UPI002900236A|nr:Maf family protein [Fusobacterium sp.]MDU1909920.1 Maf family protein [Fusobacterium sp.]